LNDKGEVKEMPNKRAFDHSQAPRVKKSAKKKLAAKKKK